MQALKDILVSAKDRIPFYRELLSNSKFDDESIRDIFLSLPVIDKKTIKNDYRSFVDISIPTEKLNEIVYTEKYVYGRNVTYEFNGKKYISDFTSGTTGTPFVSVKSLEERSILALDLWQMRNRLRPVAPKDLINILFGKGLEKFSNFEINKRIYEQLEYLKNSGFSWWVMSLFQADQFCDFITQKKRMEIPNLKVIEQTGSLVTSEEKNRIEKGMNALLASNYGCREAWTIAYTCKYFHHHLNEKSMLIELFDDNGNIITEPNKPGTLVITSLRLNTMPFIRYEIGDFVYYMDGECECGNKNKRIVITPGRQIIKGTNLYGNRFFKTILYNLSKRYNIFRFGSVNVTQIGLNEFIINTSEFNENKDVYEKCFSAQMNEKFGNMNNNYKFTYKNDINIKSVFVVNMK